MALGSALLERQAFAQELETGSPQASASLFNRTDLLLGGIFVGSLLLIDPLQGADMEISRAASADLSERNTAFRIQTRALGTYQVGLALTLSTFLVGQISGHASLKRAGLQSLEAFLLASAATQLVKQGVGRARPDANFDSDNFDPFSFDTQNNSFPSGHTSHAFAIAATMSSELKDEAPWVPYVAFPLATLTAVSRVQDRKHWATDVVAGAALGILSSRFVERLNHRSERRTTEQPSRVTWTIAPGPEGGVGVAFSVRTQ